MASILNGEQLVNARIKSEKELPVIGLKEFQPSNSWLQNRQIQSALFERKVLIEEERVEKWASLSTAIWRPAVGKAEVVRKTGKHWDVYGHHKDNTDWLYPEEALFLMEMNCLELLFEEIPMSIQRGYTVLISAETGCSLSEYRVYLHLSRQGYRVFRHDSEITVTAYEKHIRLDQYVLNMKKHSVNKDELLQSKEKEISVISSEKDDESTTDSIEILSENNYSNECTIAAKQEIDDVIQIDDSDDDNIEVVYEVTSQVSDNKSEAEEVEEEVEEEEEEEEEESDSRSDSDSNCGNWKRHSVSQKTDTVLSSLDNYRPINKLLIGNATRPAVRINYVTVNEFLYDVARINLTRTQVGNNSKVDEELTKFYNEIEVIDLDSESEDERVVVTKERKDILDGLHLLKDLDGNVVITRPDERLLPPGVRPKYPLYRINLEAIKSETQKRMPYFNQRYFRGRYNPNYNRNRFHNNNNNSHWMGNFNSNDYRNNPMNQMTQLQTMARGMMQMASAVLLNTMSSQYQSNRPRHQNQIRSVLPQQSAPDYKDPPPLIYEYRNAQQQNNLMSTPAVSFPARKEGILGAQPFQSENSLPVQNYRQYNSGPRNFPTGSRNYGVGNDESNDSEQNYSPRQYRRPYQRGFRQNRYGFNSRETNFQNTTGITEYDENINSSDGISQVDRRNEPGFPTRGFRGNRYGFNSSEANFQNTTGITEYDENINSSDGISQGYRRNEPGFPTRGFRGNRYGFKSYQPNFQTSTSGITEYNENITSTERVHQENIKKEPNIFPTLLEIKNEPNSESNRLLMNENETTNCDPAFTRQDIPTTNDFIPISGPFMQNNKNSRVHVVDINDENNDDDVIIIEEEIPYDGIKRTGKKRSNPGSRYFFLPTKKYRKQRKQRRRNFRNLFKSPRKDVEVINIDDSDTEVQPTVQAKKFKQDFSVITSLKRQDVKTEAVTDLLPVKIEKTENISQQELTFPINQIKSENDQIFIDRIKSEKESVVIVPPTIKMEKIEEVLTVIEYVTRPVTTEISSFTNVVQTAVQNPTEVINNVQSRLMEMDASVDVSRVKEEKPELVGKTNNEIVSHVLPSVVVKIEKPDLIETEQENVIGLFNDKGNLNSIKEIPNLELVSNVKQENTNVDTREDQMEVDEIRNEESNEKDGTRSKEKDIEVNEMNSNDVRDDEKSKEVNDECLQKETNVTKDNGQMDVDETSLRKERNNDNVKVGEEETSNHEISSEVINDLLDVVAENEKNVPVHIVTSNIKSWADLKKSVSTITRLEKEQEVEGDEFYDNDLSPLLKPQDCATVGSVLSALQIFKTVTPPPTPMEEENLKIMYDMYLSSVTFRKASRGVPAYRIVVLESSDPVPSPGQLMDLNARFKDDVTVLLAVVMPDSISFYILSPVTLPTQHYNV